MYARDLLLSYEGSEPCLDLSVGAVPELDGIVTRELRVRDFVHVNLPVARDSCLVRGLGSQANVPAFSLAEGSSADSGRSHNRALVKMLGEGQVRLPSSRDAGAFFP